MAKKKTAIISDVMMQFGGAEKVVENMLRIFPKADLYTLFIVPNERERIKKYFPETEIHTSIFQKLVKGNKVSKYISVIKIFSWIYWEWLDLKKYDLIVSSSHSFMSKNVKKRKDAFHLSYIHTPPRYLYKEFCEIGIIRKFPLNIILWPMMELLRWIDKRGAERPDVIVVNAENVRERVKKYYGRDARVIYPPVEVQGGASSKGNYYVCCSRLVKQKGIDLAVRVCQKNNIPLVVVGGGGEMEYLKKISGTTIKFVGNCSDKKKFDILGRAKALIYTSREEDFGIVPVEALKVGVPVIAYDSGGVRETVTDGKNGVLFNDYSEKGLLQAINRLNKMKIGESECKKSVEKFSDKHFRKQIMNLIPE